MTFDEPQALARAIIHSKETTSEARPGGSTIGLTTDELAKHSVKLLEAEHGKLLAMMQEQGEVKAQFEAQKADRVRGLMLSIASAIDPSFLKAADSTSRDVFSSLAGSLQSRSGMLLVHLTFVVVQRFLFRDLICQA